VRVVQGKGAKDRYVPLPADLLERLRSYCRQVRPRGWLFSAATDAAQALHTEQAQRWYWQARDRAGIYRRPAASTACATARRCTSRPRRGWPLDNRDEPDTGRQMARLPERWESDRG